MISKFLIQELISLSKLHFAIWSITLLYWQPHFSVSINFLNIYFCKGEKWKFRFKDKFFHYLEGRTTTRSYIFYINPNLVTQLLYWIKTKSTSKHFCFRELLSIFLAYSRTCSTLLDFFLAQLYWTTLLDYSLILLSDHCLRLPFYTTFFDSFFYYFRGHLAWTTSLDHFIGIISWKTNLDHFLDQLS